MEAHEGVMQGVVVLALDVLVIDVFRNAVVDVEQRHRVAGQAGADVFAQRAVDIHFAGYRDPAGSQAAVDVAGLETELGREGGPALVGKGHILPGALVGFRPVEQGQFKLSHALAHLGIILAFAHFLGHIGGDFSDALVAGVLFVADQQILIGALQAKKSWGRGPKVMILRLFRPTITRAIGMNSAILSASSSALPTGYSGM